MHVEDGADGDGNYSPADKEIGLEDSNFDSPELLAGVLVHEGTHALDDADFPGSRASLDNEVRAYENQVAFLRQFDPSHPLVQAYDDAKSRDDFANFIKTKWSPKLYGNLPKTRFDGPIPKPDRSTFMKGQLGEMLYEMKRNQYEGYLKAVEFERNRDQQFSGNRPRPTSTPTPTPTTLGRNPGRRRGM